ncbi:MAG: DinB family protein [bacterium]|jgi:hypothetical protein
MNSQFEIKTLAQAIPAYDWCAARTAQVVDKITPDIADWSPPTPDGSYHFRLKDIVAHIGDSYFLGRGRLDGVFSFEKFFLRPPENFVGQHVTWTPVLDFTLNEAKAHLQEARDVWAEVMARPFETAHVPSDGALRQFEEMKKLVGEGKMPERFLSFGAANALHATASLMAHETGHRGTLITLLRLHHGVSFAED